MGKQDSETLIGASYEVCLEINTEKISIYIAVFSPE
jgi:hypothetical protein